MQVRSLTPDDVEGLITIGHDLHQEGLFKTIRYSEDKLRSLASAVFENPETYRVLIAERDNQAVGFMVGYVSEYWFSDETFAADLILYVTPQHRGGSAALRMLLAFEKWATAQGVSEIRLGISTGIDPTKTESFYRKLGYSTVGPILVKEIK